MTSTSTTWHRLEPQVRGGDPSVGLSAGIHDPLWLLGRQWQMGELLGEDAAFPVSVSLQTVEYPLTRFRPGAPGQKAEGYDATHMPLEVRVEREPPRPPTLRQRLDAWTRLQALLHEAGHDDVAGSLAQKYPLPAADATADAGDARLRELAGDSAADGCAIAAALKKKKPADVPDGVAQAFLAWMDAQTPASAGDCWLTDRLEYRFAVGAGTADGEVTLTASEYNGGDLDWYDLDVDPDAAHALGAPKPEASAKTTQLLPTPVHFAGMPARRFWEFENAAVDLGAISASVEDLGRLITVEFATVFGNDWWQAPLPTAYGSLVEIQSLVVRDSFGRNVLVAPASATRPGAAPWRMFTQSDAQLAAGAGPSPGFLLLAPVTATSLRGPAIEQVLLLRDEMANLAWAVERVVEGADGRPRDRGVEYKSRMAAAPVPTHASPADLLYVLQTTVPEHWIPLVPVHAGSGAVMLQRGSLLTQDGNPRPITAQGVILSPQISPWYLHEEEVPRAGLQIRRIPAVARWLDGTPYAWVSRRVSTGRGEGSSGLQFDLAVPPEASS